MTPTLVLTRPEAQSQALAAELEALGGLDMRVIVSPIMDIVCVGDPPDLTGFAGVVLTSANGVRCGPPLIGLRVHCVGARTAVAAREAGAEVVTVARDADDLVGRMGDSGPLLHLRGEHARGTVAQRLTENGTATAEVIVYAQVARPLADAARRAIEGEAPAILPLFSPRSARLVGDTVQPGPALHAIALSPAVAEAWNRATGHGTEICAVPTAEAMLARIVGRLRRKLP